MHFIKFPKDKQRRKQCVNYSKCAGCTEASLKSSLYSKHFSSEQDEGDLLQLAKFGYENARTRHKTNAVPDIHTADIPSTSSSLLSTH